MRLVDRQEIAGVERLDIVFVNRPRDRLGCHAGSGLSNRSCRTDSETNEAESTLFHDAIDVRHPVDVFRSLGARGICQSGIGPMGPVGPVAVGFHVSFQLLPTVLLRRLFGRVCIVRGVLRPGSGRQLRLPTRL